VERHQEKAAQGPGGVDFAARLADLRAALDKRGLGGFVVPRADEHQGEYVAPLSERLAWLTGFTGSAGLAVVLRDKAAIFTDGRYTLQLRDEVDTGLFAPLHLTDTPPGEWIGDNLKPGDRLGFDPWLHTPDGVAKLRQGAEKAGGELVACPDNPLDAVWADRPGPPLAPVSVHDLRFAGKTSADKRAELAGELTKDGVQAAVLTAPDSVNWLLNLRGGDLAFTPVALCFAVLHAQARVELFLDRRKLSSEIEAHLGADVTVRERDEFAPALDALGRAGARVRADPATTAAFVFDRLEAAGAKVVRGPDPCALAKACKNEVELRGAFAAHLRDATALARFLAWLAREAPAGEVTEIAAAERLESLRRQTAMFQGPSFATISGAGPNGAIVHYRASEATDRRLAPGDLYLVDSGAQYVDGTTDVTRTVFVGGGAAPSDEQRDRFTRVLKGHIAIATARFPKGTSGVHLDALARTALWEAGLDYDHGTGHGVGSFLGVHEGPQRIAKRESAAALRPGMIVSNEPGYYKAGAFGIRIENLVTVVHRARADDGGGDRLAGRLPRAGARLGHGPGGRRDRGVAKRSD
jgi:Xaa-Pro aminopeptidase